MYKKPHSLNYISSKHLNVKLKVFAGNVRTDKLLNELRRHENVAGGGGTQNMVCVALLDADCEVALPTGRAEAV